MQYLLLLPTTRLLFVWRQPATSHCIPISQCNTHTVSTAPIPFCTNSSLFLVSVSLISLAKNKSQIVIRTCVVIRHLTLSAQLRYGGFHLPLHYTLLQYSFKRHTTTATTTASLQHSVVLDHHCTGRPFVELYTMKGHP